MSEKIQPIHIERDACVYIRQSSMSQVRHHLEGQRRQYDLRERAQSFGFQRVVVIDEDLGRSGAGSGERPGFGRLLAAVCSGQVGAVLALEASRLARNNRDWHHLIDLCGYCRSTRFASYRAFSRASSIERRFSSVWCSLRSSASSAACTPRGRKASKTSTATD